MQVFSVLNDLLMNDTVYTTCSQCKLVTELKSKLVFDLTEAKTLIK